MTIEAGEVAETNVLHRRLITEHPRDHAVFDEIETTTVSESQRDEKQP